MGITIRGCLRVQGREQHADRRTRASGGPGAGLRAREVNWIKSGQNRRIVRGRLEASISYGFNLRMSRGGKSADSTKTTTVKRLLWTAHNVGPAAVHSLHARSPGQQVGHPLCKRHVRGAIAPVGLGFCRSSDRPWHPIRAAVEADVAVTRQQLLLA